jgi:hypothetical protein
MSKQDAPYRSGRTECWIKVKCGKRGAYRGARSLLRRPQHLENEVAVVEVNVENLAVLGRLRRVVVAGRAPAPTR